MKKNHISVGSRVSFGGTRSPTTKALNGQTVSALMCSVGVIFVGLYTFAIGGMAAFLKTYFVANWQ